MTEDYFSLVAFSKTQALAWNEECDMVIFGLTVGKFYCFLIGEVNGESQRRRCEILMFFCRV